MIRHKIVHGKKVLLVDPGKRDGSIYGNSTSLGLHVLAEAARGSGWESEVVNLSVPDPVATLLSTTSTFQPLVVGFTSTSAGHKFTIELAKQVRAIAPSIIICKGGSHETYSAGLSQLNPAYPIDFSFIGEADRSFPKLLDALAYSREIGNIPGLCFNDQGVVKTSSVVKIPPTDFISPTPMLEESFALIGELSMIRVQSMRGCGFGCEFCAITGKSRRVAPPVFVEYLSDSVRSTGAQSIFFEDATFTIEEHSAFSRERKWAREFCDLFKKALPKVVFGIQTRADCLNQTICTILANAGCRSIYIGVEALSGSILRSINKATTGEAQIAAIKTAKATGIRITASLICDLGYKSDFVFTLETLSDLGVDEIFMEAEKLFPGTKLARDREIDVLSFYDSNPGSNHSLNIEDHYCYLVSDSDRINQRYLAAAQILSGYKQISVGHWVRKE